MRSPCDAMLPTLECVRQRHHEPVWFVGIQTDQYNRLLLFHLGPIRIKKQYSLILSIANHM